MTFFGYESVRTWEGDKVTLQEDDECGDIYLSLETAEGDFLSVKVDPTALEKLSNVFVALNDKMKTCPFTHAHTRKWCGYEGCRED